MKIILINVRADYCHININIDLKITRKIKDKISKVVIPKITSVDKFTERHGSNYDFYETSLR